MCKTGIGRECRGRVAERKILIQGERKEKTWMRKEKRKKRDRKGDKIFLLVL